MEDTAKTRKVVTLDDVLEKINRRQSHKWDAPARWSDLCFRPGRRGVRLAVPGRSRSLALTYTAFGQICDRLGVPAHYAATLDPVMAVRLLTYEWGRRKLDESDRPVLLRCYGNQLRGVVSDRYVPLDDAMVISALREALAGDRTQVYGFRIDNEATELRLIFLDRSVPLPRSPRVGDVVAPGFYLRNSEVGVGALAAQGYVLRKFCSNGAIAPYNVAFGRWRHMAVRPGKVVADLRRTLEWAVNEAVGVAHLLDQAAATGLKGGTFQALANLAVQERFSKELTAALVEAYRHEEHDSLFGLVNAITRAARRQPPAVRTSLEVLAGKIMIRPDLHGLEVA